MNLIPAAVPSLNRIQNNALRSGLRFRRSDRTATIAELRAWLQQIASETAAQRACLQITGHTSPTGTAALNDNLSLLRAEYIQTRLERDEPALQNRTTAEGRGSRDNIIGGTGRDDSSDAIDRRVELKPIVPCT